MSLNPVIAEVTARIIARSQDSRAAYLANMQHAIESQPGRGKLSCANWAHAFAAEPAEVKLRVLDPNAPISASSGLQRHAQRPPAAGALSGADQAGGL
jgi:phosphogluconate dehydratase